MKIDVHPPLKVWNQVVHANRYKAKLCVELRIKTHNEKEE
jgi:hypothetical protein